MPHASSTVIHLQDRFNERTLIARGNFAASYKAMDTTLRRPVFLKLLHASLSDDADIRRRFEREAQAAARLSHRSLVQLYEFGDDPDEGMYMVFEWIEGESLAARLARDKTLGMESLRDLARDLLEGLAVLHRAGVIHRDIKPENILLAAEGGAKLADYSLAMPMNEPRMTHHRAIIGTPAYMSPEQAAGRLPDERSDLFSLGVVLWEAAAGNNPYWAEDLVETLRRIRQVDPDYASTDFNALPPDLHALIRSCLAKDAGQRPSSAHAAMRLIQGGRSERGGKRRGFWMVALIAVLVLAGLAALLSRMRPTENRETARPVRADSAAAEAPNPLVSDQREADTVPQVPVTEHKNLLKLLPAEKTPRTVPVPDTLASAASEPSIPDSVDVVFDVRPWARVYVNDVELGTTPLRDAVRLPCGMQRLSFQNTQMPRVTLTVEISRQTRELTVDLPRHLSLLDVAVTPWGTVTIDNEVLGVTPLKRPVFLIPGPHMVRISHPTLSPIERSISARGGDTLHLRADMDHTTLSVTP